MSRPKLDPNFTPAFTPAEMLQLGVFEGTYLNGTYKEYPKVWTTKAKTLGSLCKTNDPFVNLMTVRSGLTLEAWQERGWITERDPLGWFQWYCRYYQGRRDGPESDKDDKHQIRRWKNFARHSGQIMIHGNKDPMVRPVQRQALLQWTYDPFPDIRAKRGESLFEKAMRIKEVIQRGL